MSKELDVSWFDLKKYDDLASMDLGGWHTQLDVRYLIFSCVSDYENTHPDLRNYDVLDLFECIKENPVWRYNVEDLEFERKPYQEISKYPFNTYSVRNTQALDIFNCASNGNFKNIWDNCKKYNEIDLDDDLFDLISTPYDLLYSNDDFETANLRINLTATDEQITNDFKYWLTEYRKHTGYKYHKNNFTNKDLAYWHELQILPLIDLDIYAAIEGVKITDETIAGLINQGVDRLRKTIKPKSAQLLRYKTLAAIEAQLSSFPKK